MYYIGYTLYLCIDTYIYRYIIHILYRPIYYIYIYMHCVESVRLDVENGVLVIHSVCVVPETFSAPLVFLLSHRRLLMSSSHDTFFPCSLIVAIHPRQDTLPHHPIPLSSLRLSTQFHQMIESEG